MAQLMPLPLTVSCFSKIQIGFTFLIPAHLGSPGKRAIKRVCVCVLQLKGRWPAHYKPKEPVESEKSAIRTLDPNHTHFILVDDGTQDKFEREIALRAKLEQQVSKFQTIGGHSKLLSFICCDKFKFLNAS